MNAQNLPNVDGNVGIQIHEIEKKPLYLDTLMLYLFHVNRFKFYNLAILCMYIMYSVHNLHALTLSHSCHHPQNAPITSMSFLVGF